MIALDLSRALDIVTKSVTHKRVLATTLAISVMGATSLAPKTYAQSSELSPFEVTYDVGNNLISAGSATLNLSRNGDEWVYSLKTTPTGVFKLTGKGKIQETSIFSLSQSTNSLQMQPQRYSYRQDEESRRSVDAWFNWDNNSLTYKRRGQEFTEDFSDPVLDRLSVTLQVMNALKTSGFQEAELRVFDNGNVKTMLFSNEGIEDVQSQMGPIKTIKVKSNSVTGGTRHTLTWFAPELDYVPIRIEQYKRNKLVARLTLTKLRNVITENGGAAVFARGVDAQQLQRDK